jgi:hypothetical protein
LFGSIRIFEKRLFCMPGVMPPSIGAMMMCDGSDDVMFDGNPRQFFKQFLFACALCKRVAVTGSLDAATMDHQLDAHNGVPQADP